MSSGPGVVLSARIIELGGKFPFAPPHAPIALPPNMGWAGRYPFVHFYRKLSTTVDAAPYAPSHRVAAAPMVFSESPIARLLHSVVSMPSLAPAPPPSPPSKPSASQSSDVMVKRNVIG